MTSNTAVEYWVRGVQAANLLIPNETHRNQRLQYLRMAQSAGWCAVGPGGNQSECKREKLVLLKEDG